MLSAARAARPRLCAAPRLPRPPRGRGLASSSGYAVGGEAQIGNPTGYPAGGAPAVLRERYPYLSFPAGAAGVSWSMFGGVTLAGALLRALAIRAVAEQIPVGLLDDWTVRFVIAGAAAALPLVIASLRVDRAQRGHVLGHFPWPWTRARWLLHRLAHHTKED